MNTQPYWACAELPVNRVNEVDRVAKVDTCQPLLTPVDESQPKLTPVDTCQRGDSSDGKKFSGDLTGAIREWVANSTGSFTTADVDREFGLVLRSDKQRRSTALKRLEEKNLILRDRRAVGRWTVNSVSLDFIDLEAAEVESSPVRLPLGLGDMVSIPPKSIICLAGSTNSGKTALAMNLIRDNIEGPASLLYLMSEMGPSEYRQRVELFGDGVGRWKSVRAAALSAGFPAAISSFNSDGLTVVDFLEEVDGEYYRIASDIRAIYDALGNGVAFVILQKATGAAYGRGGQATSEKARLYLTLDVLAHRPRSTICALRIVKAKSYVGDNPNGKEIHFRVERGHALTPVSRWMYCNERDRAAYVAKYQEYER